MSAEPNQAKSIFLSALEIQDAAQREAYLKEQCGTNAVLRGEIEQLLVHQQHVGDFLEGDAGRTATLELSNASERPGSAIGPYKLMEQIGEGGMGLVFVAEQHEPVRRKVALKLIKPGMDTHDVIARFEAERQALALMDHPHIAKVLDAGATAAGRPYFVMELVKGVPITQFCDDNRLTPRERLELFTDVCHAVQHAHQKGIIHRDIKPTNVLVASHDGRPVVKVIDFGVAKAIGPQLTEHTIYTAVAQMVGTPLYMSPEQAGMSSLDIDTRTDIYSLGVLLYELLTGTTPFDKERLKQAAYEEIRRIIREEEPQKPSTRISTTDAAPSIAAQRHTEPAKLAKLVRGDLDWIVMKALEKDRSRRYETAIGFAMDVQRYLADEPVAAGPPSAWYRSRKFARRNKVGLSVAGLVVFFLVLLGSELGWTWRDRATRHAKVAAQVALILDEIDRLEREERWPEAMELARRAELLTSGEAEAATRQRVREIVRDLEMAARLEDLRLRESMLRGDIGLSEGGALSVDPDLGEQYAAAFRDYGVDVDALSVDESARRLTARPMTAAALAAALDDWASFSWGPAGRAPQLLRLASAIDPQPWRVSFRRAAATKDVAALEKLANAPDTARQPPQSQLLLAGFFLYSSHPEVALGLLEPAYAAHPGNFWLALQLASANRRCRRYETAARYLTAARALRPNSSMIWLGLGSAFYEQENLNEAVACYQRSLELNPKNMWARACLGNVRRDQGKPDEAIACFYEALELNPASCIWYYSNIAKILLEQGKLDESEAVCRKAIALSESGEFGGIPPYSILGKLLVGQRKWDEVIANCRRALDLNPREINPREFLGSALAAQGKLDEAIGVHRQGIEISPNDAGHYRHLGQLLYLQGKLDEAIASYKRALELSPDNADLHQKLSECLRKQGRMDEAIDCLNKAIELNPKSAFYHTQLASALLEQGKLDDLILHCGKAIDIDPNAVDAYRLMAVAYERKSAPDEVIACLQKILAIDPRDRAAREQLGAIRQKQNKLDEAITVYREGLAMAPDHTFFHIQLGAILQRQGKVDGAVGCFKQAVKLEPKNGAAWYWVGDALGRQGKLDEAIASLRTSIELRPKDPYSHDRLAWLLATAPENGLRDLAQAGVHVRQAMQLAPNCRPCLATLGVAHYRAGEWKESLVMLQQANRDTPTILFLAMTHWQLGDKPKARFWYDLAVKSMDKSPSNYEELLRFRAEAAELLGVPETQM